MDFKEIAKIIINEWLEFGWKGNKAECLASYPRLFPIVYRRSAEGAKMFSVYTKLEPKWDMKQIHVRIRTLQLEEKSQCFVAKAL